MSETADNKDTTKILKRKPHRRTRLLGIAIVLLFLFLSYSGFQVLLQYFANPLLRSFLKEMVENKSNGLYSVDFDSLSLNTTARSIYLCNFKLEPNLAVYKKLKEEGKLKKAVYRIRFDELSIEHLSNLNLFANRIIKIQKVKVRKPQIWLIGFPRKKDDAEKKKYDAVNKDIMPFFEKYLKGIDIASISIKSGYFSLNLEESKNQQITIANDFNIELLNFKLDAKSNTDALKSMFYSQNIEISVKDYELLLGDSIHTLRLGEVKISTLKNEVIAKNFDLSPDQQILSKLKSKKKNFLIIKIPKIKIANFDVRKAIIEKTVSISQLSIYEPVLTLIKNKNQVKNDSAQSFTLDSRMELYPLIKGKLKSLSVDTFLLNNAKFKVYQKYSDPTPTYRVEKINIAMHNFVLDTLASKNRNKILYSDDIEVVIRNFRMEMADNLHQLYAQNLKISTLKSIIEAQNIELKRKVNPKTSLLAQGKMTYNILISNILLKGVNLIKAYNDHKLSIESIIFTKPVADLGKYGTAPTNSGTLATKPKQVDYVYELVAPYMNSLTIKEFKINNGSYSLRNEPDSANESWSEGKINFSIYKINVDRNTIYSSNKIFNAENISLSFDDYVMKLKSNFHVLNVKHIVISSIDSIFSLENATLKAEPYTEELDLLRKYKTNQIIDFSLDRISFKKIDIPSIWYNQILQFGQVQIQNPVAKLIQYPDMKFASQQAITGQLPIAYTDSLAGIIAPLLDSIPRVDTSNKFLAFLQNKLKKINFSSFNLNDGRLIWTKNDTLGNGEIVFDNQFSISADDFNFDVDSIQKHKDHFFAQDISIKLNNYSSRIAKDRYKLLAEEIGISTFKKNAYIYNLHLKPDFDFPSAAFFAMEIPTITVNNLDFGKIIEKRCFVMDTLQVERGKIRVLTNPQLRNAKKTDSIAVDTTQKMLPFNLLSIKNIIFKDNLINILRDGGQVSNSILNFQLSGELFNFQIDTSFLMKQKTLPNFDNLIASADKITVPFADSIHSIKIDHLLINTHDSTLNISEASVGYPKMNKSQLFDKFIYSGKDKLWKISAPKLAIKGVDYPKLFSQKRLTAKMLEIQTPLAQVDNYTVFSKAKAEESNWFEVIGKGLDELKIDKITIADASVSLAKFYNDSSITNTYRNVDGLISNFALDTVIAYDKSRFYYSDDISLTLKNHVFALKDSVYRISAKRMSLSSGKKTLSIDSMIYSPIYSKSEFQDHFVYQKPYFYLYLPKASFQNFSVPKLLKERTIEAQSGRIDRMNFEIYNDKRVDAEKILRGKLFPEIIDDLKMPMQIDTLKLANSRFAYEDLMPLAPGSGVIFMDSIYGQFSNISNIPEIRQQNRLTSMSVKMKLMGTANMTMFLKTTLNDTNGFTKISGTLGAMNLKDFNSYIENTVFMSINSGKMIEMRYLLEANNQYAKGSILARYKDLNISLLEIVKGKTDAKGFYSFFANTLIRKNNPKGKFRLLKDGKIYLERDTTKTAMTYWMNAFVVGMKSTMGFESKEVKENDKKDAKIKKLLNRKNKKDDAKSEDKRDPNLSTLIENFKNESNK